MEWIGDGRGAACISCEAHHSQRRGGARVVRSGLAGPCELLAATDEPLSQRGRMQVGKGRNVAVIENQSSVIEVGKLRGFIRTSNESAARVQ
jgi:hypothetical protein